MYSQLEHRVEKAQEEFEGISANIRKEVERFELQRYDDFKAAIISYLESVLNNQQQVCRLYLWLGGVMVNAAKVAGLIPSRSTVG